MSSDIRIKKGLEIKLKGKADTVTENAIASNFYTIRPEDFHGVTPKLIARQGDKLKALDTTKLKSYQFLFCHVISYINWL